MDQKNTGVELANRLLQNADILSRLLYAAPADSDEDIGLKSELSQLNTRMQLLLSRLHERRQVFVQQQLRRMRLGTDSRGLWLHLGAGARRHSPWIGVDFKGAELCLDLRYGLPFADGSAQYVYMAHVLEHLSFHGEADTLLSEVRRVLASDGAVRIVVPDIEQCLIAYASNDGSFFENRRRLWPWAKQCTTKLQHFLDYVGANARIGTMHSHKYGYDYETLRMLLEDVGYRRIVRSDYMASQVPELRVDNFSIAAGFMYRGKSYSLFVDAYV